MVIKDLLGKVSAKDADDPQVRALREKLARLQQQRAAKQAPARPPQARPATPAPVQHAAKPEDAELSALQRASEEERRRFAQDKDPMLKLQEERTHKLVAKQVGEIIELVTGMDKRIKQLELERQSAKRSIEAVEERNKEMLAKMDLIDKRLEKFMGLYEVITNQYNPFHEQKELPPERTVAVADPITGQHAAVPIQQGTLSSENMAKMQRLLAELERDEQEKLALQDPEEEAALMVREREREQEAHAELEHLMRGFEERMRAYLDTTMQERLHATLAALERVLNEEIRQAVAEEVAQLRQQDPVVDSALQEIDRLASQQHPEEFSQVKAAVVEQVRAVDDAIKAIPPSLYFRVHDGRVLKNVRELVLALQTMPEPVFQHHVHGERNDFADWVERAMRDPLGGMLRGKSRQQMIALLRQRLQ